MDLLGREQPINSMHLNYMCIVSNIVSALATNVRLMCSACNELLSVSTGRVTVDILPDNVLLHIFLLDRQGDVDRLWHLSWHRLVHVCRRWRSVVFASPNFLDLSLLCGPSTRVELLGIWPPLPIIIRYIVEWPMPDYDYDFGAAIVHHSRVREISINNISSSQLQLLASAMQEQFPALIHLTLHLNRFDGHYSRTAPAPALPDGFLGGSAPRLQSLDLRSIGFPALQKLLLSATDLVHLTLRNIPHSGYISSEAIVTGLAVMANLEFLAIAFESPRSRPDRERRRPPPPTRTTLPALTHFEFHGVSEYLEDLVARIDAPLLDSVSITFFHQLIFEVPHLAQFTRRTTGLEVLNEAHVDFDYDGVQVESLPPRPTYDETSTSSRLRITCRELEWQLSSLSQVFTSVFPSTYVVEHLYVYWHRYFPSQWQDDVENMQWLDFFSSFTTVKNLYVSKDLAQGIASALQELVGERVTGVLPALESLFLEKPQPLGPAQEAIEQFVAARQLLGHPVAVSPWKRAPRFW
jgi:hypothetical protein